MKKRSLKIMSVVLAGVMTTGMILGGCSAGGDKENGGNKEASKELNLWMHNGQAFVDETKCFRHPPYKNVPGNHPYNTIPH